MYNFLNFNGMSPARSQKDDSSFCNIVGFCCYFHSLILFFFFLFSFYKEQKHFSANV